MNIQQAVNEAVAYDLTHDSGAAAFYTPETLAELAEGVPTMFVRSVVQGDGSWARVVKTLGVSCRSGRQVQLRELGSVLIPLETTERMLERCQREAEAAYGKGTPVEVLA